MQSTQIAVRLPDELLAQLDRQIPRRFASRAEAVRVGLAAVLAEESIEEREERHRRGWLAHPLDAHGQDSLLADGRALIAEEPW